MKTKTLKIAILGATSHIARGLITRLSREPLFSLYLFARSTSDIHNFIDTLPQKDHTTILEIIDDYGGLSKNMYDVIINCIGVGTERKLQGDYAKYFTVTEEYDNLILHYLKHCCPDTLYINFSSGAIYGRNFFTPASEDSTNCISINNILPQDYYGIARLNSEAKHRSLRNFRIIDLRVFSYFSSLIDLEEGYFISDIIDCILNNKTLETSDVNIVRDYIHPDDIFLLILKCFETENINTSFDVMSSNPVDKWEIINYFSENYGLRYSIINNLQSFSPTGSKNMYYSKFHNTSSIGFTPKYSSIETIQQESEHILASRLKH